MTQPSSPFFPQLTEIAAIKATVLKQPGELHAARLTVADAERALGGARRRLKDLEAQIADERASIDALVVGNPELKNEAQRKAETAKQMKASPTIASLKAAVAGAQDDVTRAELALKQAELQVKLLEDQQRAWRAHLDATQAEVQLLVAGR